MKGAKRILSVFLLLVMLCTFFAFPANAITFLDPYTWDLSETAGPKVELLSNGNYRITSTAPSIIAYFADLEPGSSYDLGMRFATNNVTSGGTFTVGVVDQNDKSFVIFESIPAWNGTSYVKTASFKVPDDYVFPRLCFVSVNCAQIVFSSSSVLEDKSTDKGILNSIKEGFSKLWEWLRGIWDSIKEIPAKVGQFITNLGDRISTFFSNLTNSIKGFFTDLWDKIWNGDGSVPPFDNNNKFAQVIDKLNEWTAKIKDFSGSVDSSADTVTGYIRSGTTFLNSAMGAFPAALTAVLGFALVFIVVRKVVGR